MRELNYLSTKSSGKNTGENVQLNLEKSMENQLKPFQNENDRKS